MADSHLQALIDGTTKMEKTQLLSKSRYEECLKAWFGTSPWKVESCNKETGNKFIISVSCGEIEKRYIVYLVTIRDEARQDDEYKSQLGNSYPAEDELKLEPLVFGVYVTNENCKPEECLIASFKLNNINFSTNPSLRGVRTKGLSLTRLYGLYQNDLCTIFRPDFLYYYINKLHGNTKTSSIEETSVLPEIEKTAYNQYLAAMRTKPFLLLAGISGTGKSRIVKEMAFASCPPSLRGDDVTPGNYCMIEVKPNWHDSTELIGYVSSIPEPHYVVTPFVNFLIKAMHNPKAPFFVCLDEMNLAPVEQYFAEFLSVLESRKLVNGEIVSEPLIKADYTKAYIDNFVEAFTGKKQESGSAYDGTTSDPAAQYMSSVFEDIKENGLRLPPNVIVVGTVNMDETTYQFSRKVIDRAMTIEMNEVDFDSMFGETADTLKYRDPYVGAEYFLPKYTAAKDALTALNDADHEYLKENIPATLKSLDAALTNTPFRIAYRVENELILYFAALREEHPDATAEALLATAVDDILMMKVLPRIEGNEDVLTDPLSRLENFTRENYPKAHAKVGEMQARLEANHFTSFWP